MNPIYRSLIIACVLCIPFQPPLAAQRYRPPDTLGLRFTAQSKAWVEVRDSGGIIQHAFTFECWIRLRGDGIIASRDAFVDTTSDWQLMYERYRERIVLITHYGTVDQYYSSPNGILPLNVWKHLALVMNGPDGFARLYVDGAPVWELALPPRHFDARTGLAIAGYFDNTKGAYIDCDITEVRYWAGERSAEQIRRYCRSRIPVAERGSLRGYWRFSRTLADSSGWRNNLKMRGTATYIPVTGLAQMLRSEDFPDMDWQMSPEIFFRKIASLPD